MPVIRTRISNDFYAVFSIVFFIAWPFILITTLNFINFIEIFTLNLILFVTVYKRSSSARYSFKEGLSVVSMRFSSGCANITIIYMPVFHAVLYIVMILLTIIGFFVGKDFTRNNWTNIIYKFDD